jgi:hypothetical protein
MRRFVRSSSVTEAELDSEYAAYDAHPLDEPEVCSWSVSVVSATTACARSAQHWKSRSTAAADVELVFGDGLIGDVVGMVADPIDRSTAPYDPIGSFL